MKSKYSIGIDVNPEKINGHVAEYRVTGDRIKCSNTNTKWLLSTNNWSVTNKDLIALGFKNFKADTENNIDLQDKKLYRYPKLDLPRQKVDLLKNKFNCKVIRDREKADIHVISGKFIDDLITANWGGSIDFSSAFQLFKFMKTENLITQCGLDKVKEIVSDIPHDSKISLQLRYHDRSIDQRVDNIYNLVRDCVDSINSKNTYSRDYTIKDANIPIYNNILNSEVQVVTDIDICNIVDKDLAVLDNIEYDSIESMIKSNDIENRTLALEMLANCNLYKSFDVISGIFFWNYEWCKSTTNWNTVNVKTLRKRMQAYRGDHSKNNYQSHNGYIKALKEDNKLTDFAINKTKESLYKNVLGNIIGENAHIFSVDFENLKLKNKQK
tara:strand:- start:474 stop:1622 length:1149 start_codon:yes stop_codon:yes gene_type:complete